ncbi:MAG TPA: hypothetical protein VGB32_14360 [Candidatus Bathyarchaeia archaeon]
MPAILFWEWMQGVDHVRPVSRVVLNIVDAVNKDRDRIKGVDLVLTEVDVHDAFKEGLENPPFTFNLIRPLNGGYRLELWKDPDSFYGIMRVVRPWGKTTRILGESWWFSVEVSTS